MLLPVIVLVPLNKYSFVWIILTRDLKLFLFTQEVCIYYTFKIIACQYWLYVQFFDQSVNVGYS